MGKWGKGGGTTGPGGRVSPGPKVTVQPKRRRMRLGSAGGVYVSSFVREGGARHRPSAGAGLRVCRRLLGDGPSAFVGWVVWWLGVAVGSIGKGSMLLRTTTCQFVWMEAGCPVESGLGVGQGKRCRGLKLWGGGIPSCGLATGSLRDGDRLLTHMSVL